MSVINKLRDKLHYFGDMSNLHGVGHVLSTSHVPAIKRCFWAAILLACCIGAGTILKSSLELFATDAASYSVLTDYLEWDTPFPAVTVCEQSDTGRAKMYLNQTNQPSSLQTFYKEVAFWNVNYCRVCNTCRMNETCVENFIESVRRIRLKCTELLSDCWFGGIHFKCCDKFHKIQTEYGSCFVFNSAVINSTLLTVNRRVGLPTLEFSAKELVGMRIHAPEETVSATMENILGRAASLPLVTKFDVILKVEQTVNDASVNSISPAARGCLFAHETPGFEGWPFNRYTYSSCLLYCRGQAQDSLCNCTHHFLADIVKIPACDVEGLACLYQNKDHILKFKCNCPMACEDIQYKVVHVFFDRVAKAPSGVSQVTRARVRLAQLPTLRVRRFAIRDKLGLAVDIGGVGGVFFGASLLSVIEIVYLFCVRKN
ncbi:sodium channel protein Nach-like [Aricia agestis]|uniref:sodium channel protein Nach-like n=1 Tax=Aricia agestis TaxID=91739 RepID=UPI001C20BCAD|nr:sodium channel protein Nach-like [Aricia agestis]